MGRIDVPEGGWSPKTVKALNEFQEQPMFHPFTCPNRSDGNHQTDYEKLELADLGLLRATSRGWVCYSCNYTQRWAHSFMAEEVGGVRPEAAL